jgi:hypothetical protein
MPYLGNLGEERRRFLLVAGYDELELEKLGDLNALTPEQFAEIVRRKFGNGEAGQNA